jgi:DNA gyrase subunit A
MATNIPPHNLGEIVAATIQLIQKPDTSFQDICKIVLGPDFPTGGIILGQNGIIDYLKTGRGSIKLRAKAAIETVGKDRQTIVVTELPYQVNKARLIEHTAGLINEKKIEGISDVLDHSDREGMRVVYELKRGEQPEVVLNNLYKFTQLQVNFGVIMLAIVGGQPRELGIIDAIKRFIDHRVDVVRRRTDFLLRKARDREHLLLGFRRALQNLDRVIEVIRASKNPKEAREHLMEFVTPDEAKEYAKLIEAGERGPRFTEKQAQAIIELQLQRLTGMEQDKILAELADIQRLIGEYMEILGSDKALRNLIIKELREVQKDFADDRRTQIVEDTGEIQLEDLVQMEDVAVTVTRGGYLKRTPVDTYRRQTRGGKGRIGMGTRAEDAVEHLIISSTHSYIMMFTNKGRVYWLKVYHIPDVGTSGKGKNIGSLITLQADEYVKAFLPVKEFENTGKFIVMITKLGVIKKCELDEFANVLARGIIAVSLDEGDELISARLTNGENFIFIGTYQGKAIRFPEGEVRPMGRPARGVRAMDLAEGDYIVGAEVVEKNGLVLSISEQGYGKRTELKEYRLTARGGKGIINMKITSRIGHVVAVLSVKEDSDLMIITQDGKIIRIDSSEIRQAGRSTQGVRLVRTDEGDLVAGAGVLPESEVVVDDGQGDLPLQ